MFEIPFNTTDKFLATVHKRDKWYFISFKDAPGKVFEQCSTPAFGNETRALDDEIKKAYTESCYILANNGERVLGFADRDLPASASPPGFIFKADPPNFPLQNLRLVISFMRNESAVISFS